MRRVREEFIRHPVACNPGALHESQDRDVASRKLVPHEVLSGAITYWTIVVAAGVHEVGEAQVRSQGSVGRERNFSSQKVLCPCQQNVQMMW